MKKKELTFCENCKKEISSTMNKYRFEDRTICYKCYLGYERTRKEEIARSKDSEIIDRMYRMKYFCPKCKKRRNDFGASFCIIGVLCQKCGSEMLKIIKEDCKLNE